MANCTKSVPSNSKGMLSFQARRRCAIMFEQQSIPMARRQEERMGESIVDGGGRIGIPRGDGVESEGQEGSGRP